LAPSLFFYIEFTKTHFEFNTALSVSFTKIVYFILTEAK